MMVSKHDRIIIFGWTIAYKKGLDDTQLFQKKKKKNTQADMGNGILNKPK